VQGVSWIGSPHPIGHGSPGSYLELIAKRKKRKKKKKRKHPDPDAFVLTLISSRPGGSRAPLGQQRVLPRSGGFASSLDSFQSPPEPPGASSHNWVAVAAAYRGIRLQSHERLSWRVHYGYVPIGLRFFSIHEHEEGSLTRRCERAGKCGHDCIDILHRPVDRGICSSLDCDWLHGSPVHFILMADCTVQYSTVIQDRRIAHHIVQPQASALRP
jgi:hypothetical protein